MKLTKTQIASVLCPNGTRCVCGVGRFENERRVVIAVVERRDNKGMSITNAAEQVWSVVSTVEERSGRLADGRVVHLLEHYTMSGCATKRPHMFPRGGSFAVVTFDDPVACRGPRWLPAIPSGEMMNDYAGHLQALAVLGGEE